VARGLTEAMHGTLEPEQTPGGGLTMTISLPAAAPGQPSHIAAGLSAEAADGPVVSAIRVVIDDRSDDVGSGCGGQADR